MGTTKQIILEEMDLEVIKNNLIDILEAHEVEYPNELISDLAASIYDKSIFASE